MKSERMAVFAPLSGRDFGARVCASLGLPLAEHEEREFEDGEHKMRPLTSVRGLDVFVADLRAGYLVSAAEQIFQPGQVPPTIFAL